MSDLKILANACENLSSVLTSLKLSFPNQIRHVFTCDILQVNKSEDDDGSRAVFDDVDCFRSQG